MKQEVCELAVRSGSGDNHGTDPDHQGQGLASAVMQPVLTRCDAEGVPAYLESTKERNVGFYEGHGFVVRSEEQIPLGGPQLWLMWREPR